MRAKDCRVEDLAAVVAEETLLADYPLADRVESNVLVYAAATLRAADRGEALHELARALRDGPGVVIIEGAMEPAIVDRATEVFFGIIDQQNAAGQSVGDHFAKPGANDRIWNSLEKLALADPGVFVDYHGNDIIDMVSTAWLGPAYQMTAQVNVVNPGGAAQNPHRDYHLGFMSSNDADMTENLMAAECTTILDALLAESGRKLPGVAGMICAGMDEDVGCADPVHRGVGP